MHTTLSLSCTTFPLLLLAGVAAQARDDAKPQNAAADAHSRQESLEAATAQHAPEKSPDQKAFAGNWEVVAVQLRQPRKQGQRLLSVGHQLKFQGLAFAAPGGVSSASSVASWARYSND